MTKSGNNRFCVQASLHTLSEQRRKICDDSKNKSLGIFLGLHESNDVERSLYFEKYIVIWLDEHWNRFRDICNDNSLNYSESYQKQFVLFFAGYYSKYMLQLENEYYFTNLMIPDILKIKIEQLDTLLNVAEKHNEKFNELLLASKKHSEWYNKKIEELKKELQEVH